MYQFLHPEPFDDTALRADARRTVEAMDIIQGAARGEARWYGAMLCEFWPYVAGFERTIDRRMVAMLPQEPLYRAFGRERIRTWRKAATAAVRQMKEEEGSHAAMWQADAERLGLPLHTDALPSVAKLLDDIDSTDSPVFFFAQLAATEFIAEELTALLCAVPGFIPAFHPEGWAWGNAHLPHEGASHLMIDLDIARAYWCAWAQQPLGRADAVIANVVLERHRLFARAAAEVSRHTAENWT